MKFRPSGILFVSRDLAVGGGSAFIRDITPFISERGVPSYVLASGGKFTQAIREGADGVWTPLIFAVAPVYCVKMALRKLKPAAVIVNKLKWAAKIIDVCEDADIPLFVRYNVDSQGDDKPHIAATKPRLSGFFYVCEELAKPLRKDPTICARTRWLPIPVADHLMRAPLPPMPDKGFVVVSGNRTSHLKGQAVLAVLDILPRLLEHIPDFQFVVLGGGGLMREIRQRSAKANELYGRSTVSAVGETDNPYWYMAQGHCVLGSAHVAQEALALGRHVVCCGFKGYPTLVTPDNIGWCIHRNFGDFDYEYEYSGVDRERMFVQLLSAYEAYKTSPVNEWGREYIMQNHTGSAVADVLIGQLRELGAQL